jgi:hypothetical protein
VTSGYEQELLTRAQRLDEVEELTARACEVIAGVQAAGADRRSVASLLAAANLLEPGCAGRYDDGEQSDRRAGTCGYRSDIEFLEAVSGLEDDGRDRLRQARNLAGQAAGALDDAETALGEARDKMAAALAMSTISPCGGCHRAKTAAIVAADAAIRDARDRISVCEAALDILGPLDHLLTAVADRLQAVPADLGEVYVLIYQFVRSGGRLPQMARWIQGQATPA